MAGKERKLTQRHGLTGRYFSMGTKVESDDNEIDKKGAGDDSDDDSDMESDVAEDELQQGDDDDDDSSNSAEDEMDEDKSDSDEELGDSDSDSEEEEASDSKEETKHGSHKKIMPSRKQKTPTKQHNNSLKPSHELPKFQGIPKEGKQSEKLNKDNSAVSKRKKGNKDHTENEVSPPKMPHTVDDEIASALDKRRGERDARALFLKNLPPNTTAEMIKKLSPEIINVRIPLEGSKKVESLYAFVEFEKEEAAERNYKMLSEKQIGNKKFTVDYCGEKSKFKKAVKEYPVNERRLFIPNVPLGISADELKQHFPEARHFTTKLRGTKRLVFVSFETEDKAKEAFEQNSNLVISGKKLTVLYAFKKKPGGTKKKPRRKLPQIVKPVFENEEDYDSTNKEQKSKEELETNSKMTKTTKNKSKKKLRSNLETNKSNDQKCKPVTKTTKLKAKKKIKKE